MLLIVFVFLVYCICILCAFVIYSCELLILSPPNSMMKKGCGRPIAFHMLTMRSHTNCPKKGLNDLIIQLLGL